MTRLIGSVLLVAAMAALPADAQVRVRSACYSAPSYSYYPSVSNQYYTPSYSYYAPTYRNYETVTTQFLAVPTFAYGLGYTGTPDATLKLDLLQLKNELLQSRNEFLQFQLKQSSPAPTFQPRQQQLPPMGQPEQVQAPQGQLHEGGKLIMQDCATCHDATTKSKGGGLMLTQGGAPLKYDLATQARIMRELYTGRMPPGKKYADKDGDQKVGAIFAHLDQQK